MSSNKATFPSDEQKAVLDAKDRIIVVKAAPGSGKTSVFIEFLRNNLDKFPNRRSGIAALSFTNAAQEEISKRLGSTIPSQHFIGTLDSFLLKFVVKPFFPTIGLCPKGAELLPSPLDENMTIYQVQYSGKHADRMSAFSFKFSSGTIDAPIFMARNGFQTAQINGEYADRILKEKLKIWKNKGLVTHSDCHYISALILTSPKLGTQVRNMIARRFPLILVDEFQDTGCFLSIALKQLLDDSSVRSLVVGDPDQSIYEFSGATPELFAEIQKMNGAVTKPITKSQRCSPNICEIARKISDTNTDLRAVDGKQSGKQILFVHGYDKQLRVESKLIETLKAFSGGPGELAFLSRSNKLVRQLCGDHSDIVFVGKSNAGRIFTKAVIKLKQGDANSAFNLASARLGTLIFSEEGMRRKDFEAKGINYGEWKIQVFRFLKELSRDISGESWNGWLERAKEATQVIMKFAGVSKSIGSSFAKDNEKGNAIKELIAPPSPSTDEIIENAVFKSIHGAKGAEYDSVVVFYPKPHANHAPCISTTWFGDMISTEEKRVGYVALTRARKNLVLCVHKNTFSELQKNQKEFLAHFEVLMA
ncbi:MAG: UvrD-helicase domain-containing protein [Bdellovibrio sp.]